MIFEFMGKDKIDEELSAIIIQDIKLLPIDNIRPFGFFLLYVIEGNTEHYKLFLKTLKEKVELNTAQIDRADLIIDLLEMLIQ